MIRGHRLIDTVERKETLLVPDLESKTFMGRLIELEQLRLEEGPLKAAIILLTHP